VVKEAVYAGNRSIGLEVQPMTHRVIETINRLKTLVHFPSRGRGKKHIRDFLSLYRAYYNHWHHRKS
jgi:hypothetical protein